MKTVPMKMLSFAPNNLHTLILRLLKASKVYLSDLNKTREEHEKEDKRVGYIPLNSLSSPLETKKKKKCLSRGRLFFDTYDFHRSRHIYTYEAALKYF